MLKYNKNKGIKKNEGRNIREEKKMRGGKKKKKMVSHPVSNRQPNDQETCAVPTAQHKALQQALRNLCYNI